MQKKYNILTLLDVPIPSYDRAYRNVLFINKAPKEVLKNVYVISPKSYENFHNKTINVIPDYFSANDFKKNQYKLSYRLYLMLQIFIRLVRFRIKNVDIDFIRTGTTYLSFFILLTQRKNSLYIADICDFYSDLYKEYQMPFSKVIASLIGIVEKHATKRADLIFVDTPKQREYQIKNMNIRPDRCIVIPNGVMLEHYKFSTEKNRSILKKYGFTSGDKVLFYGGDISKADGIEYIIQYVRDHKNIKTLIIGKGNQNYIQNIKKKIKIDGLTENITLDSFKKPEEVYKYISIADVCLAPFQLTSTTNTVECGKIISYLMMGKKVLSTDADGVKALYKNNIEYFKNNDYPDFSRKLTKVLDKKINKNEKVNLRKYAEKFSFQKIILHEYKVIDEYFKNPEQNFQKYDYI